MAAMPDRLVIDGVAYVREDSVHDGAPAQFEESYSVPELATLTGFSKDSIYWNIRKGRLASVSPYGTERGVRVMRSDWEAFVDANRTKATPASGRRG